MPRIRQKAKEYAVADFQQEIRRQQGYHNLMSVRALAKAIEVPHTTLNPKLKEPHKLTVAEIQKLVSVLHPDIGILLTLLGYSKQEIEKYFKNCSKGCIR